MIVKSIPLMGKRVLPAEAEIGRRGFGLVIGWSALALYLVVCAPASLGLAALLGSFDCNHQILVRAGDRGLILVLHHRLRCDGDRHGVIAWALTCFAQPSNIANSDHVIHFAAADTLSPMAHLALLPLYGSEQSAAALTEVVFGTTAETGQHFAQARPPPGDYGPFRCRTTILLI